MAAIVAAWFVPPRPPSQLLVVGAALWLAGVALGGWAKRSLGSAFTVFPEPRGPLVTAGAYRHARHPMYGAGLLVLAGISLAVSYVALVLTGVLAFLWWRKSVVEERRLGPEYVEYRRRVPHRFFPLPWPRGDAP
jgi:protein-S-isoprenylcysteine O-methyltransferase Ste14